MSLVVAVRTADGVVIGADRSAVMRNKATCEVKHTYHNACKLYVYSSNIVIGYAGTSSITTDAGTMTIDEWFDSIKTKYPNLSLLELPVAILREYEKVFSMAKLGLLIAGIDEYCESCMITVDCDTKKIIVAGAGTRGAAIGLQRIAKAILDDVTEEGLNASMDGMQYSCRSDGIELVETIIYATGVAHSLCADGGVGKESDIYYIDIKGKKSGWVSKYDKDVVPARKPKK